MEFDKLIDLHFGTLMNYKAASIQHYLETGTVSGTFRSELKAMLKEACEGKADSTSEKDLRVCEVIVPVSDSRICLAGKEFSYCEFHSDNKFGCADCGNFKKEE